MVVALELLEIAVYAFGGWLYLLSPDFRKQTHNRWRFESRLGIAFEMFEAILGMAVSVGVAGFLVQSFLF